MTADVNAGIYCRISLATLGDTTKTDDQERISRDLAERLGWGVGPVYTDHNRSAWQRNRRRPGWDQMLADVEAGKIGAIIVYHGDRLIRQPWDLEVLLNLADNRGVRLASPTGIRNLDNADDRFILRIEAAQACRQSDDTSRRKKAQYERMRRAGLTRPGGAGGRVFGFATDGVSLVEAEAAAVRSAAAMVLAGTGTREIARWLNDEGHKTVCGNEFGYKRVRNMLTRPRYAGLMPDGVSVAAWAPVVDRADWERVCQVLDERTARYGIIPTTRKYLLSGLARCSECERPLDIHHVPKPTGRVTGYRCLTPGCRKVYRSQPLLDAYVARRTVRRLSNPGNPAARELSHPRLAREFAALTQARTELEEVLADHSRGRLPALLARLDSLDRRLAELRADAGEDARWRLIQGHQGITAAEFDGLPVGVRRQLVTACFDVIVLPASKRGPGFRTQDVRMTAR